MASNADTSEARPGDCLPGAPRGPRSVHLRITAGSSWRFVDFREMWRFRGLLGALAVRDVKLRYRQTVLGALWVVLQPLLGAGIFSFVFGLVAGMDSGTTPYFLFSYAGLLAWNVFGQTLGRATGSLLSNGGLVSKIYFPRLLLPVSTAFSVLVDFGVAFLGLLGLMLAYGMPVGPAILTVPIWLGMLLALALGAGMFFGALAVRYRDVNHILPVATQFLLYASPVAYAASKVPDSVRGYYSLNPLVPILEGFRWAAYGTGEPGIAGSVYAAAWACAVLAFGAAYFTRVEKEFADVI